MRKNKGITLIVLIITIIILLILTGITIGTLTGEDGLISKVQQAKKMEIETEMKEKLILLIDELQIEKEGKASLNNITEDYLQEQMSEYEVKVISDSELLEKQVLIKKGEVQRKFIIDENLNVIEIENSTSKLKFSYIENKREGNKIKVLITVEEKENGIEKIIFPDQDALICNNSKETIGIDYEVELGKEYIIKIVLGNGAEKEEIILIENKIIDYWPLISNLNNNIQNRDNMEVTEGQVSFDDGVYLDGNTTIETIDEYKLPSYVTISLDMKDVTENSSERYAYILSAGNKTGTNSSNHPLGVFGFMYDAYYPVIRFYCPEGGFSETKSRNRFSSI